jgi:hypothetical protein
MTAQIADGVEYRGRMYALTGIDGWGLFEPSEHGLRMGMISTACWRGYVCQYAVDDDQLILTALRLGMAEPPTQLFGADLRLDGSAATYSPIRVPLPFTGGWLLGARFIHDLYVHMGRHPAWKYAEVLELLFDEGQLSEVADRSELMAQRRAAQGTLSPTDPRDFDLWIETTFDRSYPPML